MRAPCRCARSRHDGPLGAPAGAAGAAPWCGRLGQADPARRGSGQHHLRRAGVDADPASDRAAAVRSAPSRHPLSDASGLSRGLCHLGDGLYRARQADGGARRGRGQSCVMAGYFRAECAQADLFRVQGRGGGLARDRLAGKGDGHGVHQPRSARRAPPAGSVRGAASGRAQALVLSRGHIDRWHAGAAVQIDPVSGVFLG